MKNILEGAMKELLNYKMFELIVDGNSYKIYAKTKASATRKARADIKRHNRIWGIT